MEKEQFHGIIPARYAASRFPGKPLTPIAGHPMFVHVYTRAQASASLASITVATDDTRIMDVARHYSIPCLLTRADHQSGTDRIYEAACALQLPDTAVIVNIQGDEPALAPSILQELLSPFHDPSVQVSTLATELAPEEAHNPDRVKVVCQKNGDALYFSRHAIPFQRDADAPASYKLHLGLYAFRMQTLRYFTQLSPTQLEQTEKLEQLRLLENGIPIRVVMTKSQSHSVDRPEDVPRIEAILAQEKNKML